MPGTWDNPGIPSQTVSSGEGSEVWNTGFKCKGCKIS